MKAQEAKAITFIARRIDESDILLNQIYNEIKSRASAGFSYLFYYFPYLLNWSVIKDLQSKLVSDGYTIRSPEETKFLHITWLLDEDLKEWHC